MFVCVFIFIDIVVRRLSIAVRFGKRVVRSCRCCVSFRAYCVYSGGTVCCTFRLRGVEFEGLSLRGWDVVI